MTQQDLTARLQEVAAEVERMVVAMHDGDTEAVGDAWWAVMGEGDSVKVFAAAWCLGALVRDAAARLCGVTAMPGQVVLEFCDTDGTPYSAETAPWKVRWVGQFTAAVLASDYEAAHALVSVLDPAEDVAYECLVDLTDVAARYVYQAGLAS